MRKLIVAGVVIISALAFYEARTYGQAPNDLPNPYKTETFGQLPQGRKLGQAYGIDIDRDGKSVWVFERCGGMTCDGSNLAPLLKFDSSGRLVASFGAGMFVYPPTTTSGSPTVRRKTARDSRSSNSVRRAA